MCPSLTLSLLEFIPFNLFHLFLQIFHEVRRLYSSSDDLSVLSYPRKAQTLTPALKAHTLNIVPLTFSKKVLSFGYDFSITK